MIEQLSKLIPGIRFNGNTADFEKSIHSILSVNISRSRLNSNLLQYLDENQIAVSGGDRTSSHVLKELGVEKGSENIRFSFSKFNTLNEIDHVAELLAAIHHDIAA